MREDPVDAGRARPVLTQQGSGTENHPVTAFTLIGQIILDFDAMELPAQPGRTRTAYSTGPGTPKHDALRLLASWAATENALLPTAPIPPTGEPGAVTTRYAILAKGHF
ncbi:hypothetical protein ACIRF8_35515 [Streptomyces sp. NPDC102406]|uniref:hypothetical protein n=1 Tax=Streptomyces sp. NPDC102406 TaxID=3366171 RepID=UPI0038100F9C